MNIIDEIKYNFRQQDNGLIKIILINVIVFVVMGVFWVLSRLFGVQGLFDVLFSILALPAEFSEFIIRPWTLLTYFFTHSMTDLLHILFNMLFLYWFGKLISEYVGNRRLINLYILGGLVGGLIYLLMFNLLPFYAERAAGVRLIGASGSVYAVVVAAATLLPHHRFNLLLLGPVKITYIAAFFIFISFLGTVGENAGGNICHLGGALLGYIFIQQLRKGTDLGKPINKIAEFFNNIGKPKMKVTYRSGGGGTKSKTAKTTPKGQKPNSPTQAEVDLILDKINKSGYESLSKEEKEKLFKASSEENK